MPRFAVLAVLLIAMLWQSVAMARFGSSVNVLADAEHAALHWHEQSHQHDDDGSYQVGDTADSTRHVAWDHVSATTALLTAPAPGFPAAGSSRPAVDPPAHRLDHLPDGLLRPPRSQA